MYLDTEITLSENQNIVYRIFIENPEKSFMVGELIDILNKKGENLSRRTVYRVVNKLISTGKINSDYLRGGVRILDLSNYNSCKLICKQCLKQEIFTIDKKYNMHDLFLKKNKFNIHNGYIKFYGYCNRCIEQNL